MDLRTIERSPPVIIRAASSWSYSNLSVSLKQHPSHNSHAYSSNDKIYVTYILFKLFLFNMNFNFLRTNICLVAFWHILFICSAHLPLLDMVTPKCLWLSTWFKLSELNFRFIGFMFCRNEITIYSVFWGLKSISHCFAQLSKTWRSRFNLSSTSNGLVDENIKELSWWTSTNPQ